MKYIKSCTSIVFFISFITTIQVEGQVRGAEDMASRGDHRMQNTFMKLASSLDKSLIYDDTNTNGSKYFNKNFTIGKVYVGVEKQKEIIPVRYNAYQGFIEIQNGDEIQVLVQDPKISCSINGDLYVYTNYNTKKSNDTSGYLKVLYEGDAFTLYKQELVTFREAKPAKSSMTTSFPAKYVQYENFYFKATNSQSAIEINKKTFPKAFNNKQAEVKSYIKKNNIDMKSENDLLKLFTFYHGLE